MEHYTGKTPSDKMLPEAWNTLMLHNARGFVLFDMETLGQGYEAAKIRAKKKSCAGQAIWEALDKEFLPQPSSNA